jgi:CPA2 family monovalent cation:H+ antiporter-2
VGALAAGLALSGNRLSHQVDTILLPFRETFAAVFFVTLGMLLDGRIFLAEPLLLGFGLCGMLLLKAAAAVLALRTVGLSWASSLGMGMGLAQLGEFSFLLVAQGVSEGIIGAADYNRMLFVALGTLILTPWLLSYGLRMTDERADHEQQRGKPAAADEAVASGRVIVIGIGPIGRQLASRMELLGIEVCLVDLSPINLFPFAQQGFRTVAGDARDPDVLQRCGIAACRFVVICVPDDHVALDVVRGVRTANLRVPIIVRCRFLMHAARLIAAGAAQVVSEEAEAAGRLLQACERLTRE